jgi:hypothetical protein
MDIIRKLMNSEKKPEKGGKPDSSNSSDSSSKKQARTGEFTSPDLNQYAERLRNHIPPEGTQPPKAPEQELSGESSKDAPALEGSQKKVHRRRRGDYQPKGVTATKGSFTGTSNKYGTKGLSAEYLEEARKGKGLWSRHQVITGHRTDILKKQTGELLEEEQ